MNKGIFRILNTPNNFIAIQQFSNLKTTKKNYNGVYKTIAHKTEDDNTPEQFTMHAVDPSHYVLIQSQEELGIY